MIVLQPEAELDLVEASGWYEQQKTGLGNDFLDEIARLFGRIEAKPLLHRKFQGELRRAVMRRFPYCVYYSTDGVALITIYGVLHQRRAPAIWQRRYR